MNDPIAIISAIAAVISSIGGGIACVAAFKSAKHAKDAFDAGQLTEKRLLLRQLSVTAHEVSVEVDRIKWIAQGLRISYKTLFSFSGQFNSSGQKLSEEGIDLKLQEAEGLLAKARPFTTFAESLLNGPLEEISSREIAIAQTLVNAKNLRAKLEDENRSIEAQNQSHRERVLKNSSK